MKKQMLMIAVICGLLTNSCKNADSNTEENTRDSSQVNTENPQQSGSYLEKDSSIVNALNGEIIQTGLKTGEEIMNAYRPKSKEAEGNYKYEISKNPAGENAVEVTLTETGIMDDSLEGVKVVMELNKEGNEFKVISIKEAYKCWKGRGHEDWGPALCN